MPGLPTDRTTTYPILSPSNFSKIPRKEKVLYVGHEVDEERRSFLFSFVINMTKLMPIRDTQVDENKFATPRSMPLC